MMDSARRLDVSTHGVHYGCFSASKATGCSAAHSHSEVTKLAEHWTCSRAYNQMQQCRSGLKFMITAACIRAHQYNSE
jgi:hypothetical protein